MIPDDFVMVEGRVNDRWPVALTSDRAEFHKARPLWEAGRLAHMAELVRPGMTIYDVGAECGDFTGLYATWVGPEGTVIPFEPKPEMWPSIRLHWDANTRGIPAAWWPGFAGDVTDLAQRHDELDALGWPAEPWPIWADAWPPQADPGFRHLRDGNAPQVRLDDLAAMTQVLPDVVVIDVEGAEWNVLLGAEELSAEARPVFYVSVHDVGDESWPGALEGWYGHTAADLDELMAERRYTRTELEAHGEGERFFVYEPA